MATHVVSVVQPDVRRKGQLYVGLAALVWSTAGLLQRELSVDVPTQLAGRALFAFLALAALSALSNRARTLEAFRSMGLAGLAVAVCTVVASSSFIVALNHANVANVLFMLALAPIAAAVLAWIVLGEAVTARSWVAMSVALVGVAVMVGGPGTGGSVGVAMSLVMTGAFAAALVITRHRREVSMLPAICLSQFLVLVAFVPFADPASVGSRDLVFLVLLGAGQMALGLFFLTIGARLIPAAEVALITLLEIVLGPLWVWIALSERPSSAALLGGLIVIIAVLIQTTREPRASPL
ncbi:MAG TPA: DMT family transporter [Gaiellaceae bacterium]|nr:DMT family transporter [Gaiellaceae bacterium]